MANAEGKKRSPRKAAVEVGEVFIKDLPVVIDDKAVAKKEHRIRVAMREKVKLKEDIKPVQDRIKALTEECNQLAEEADSLTEVRQVKCHLEYDFVHREVHTRRLDTKQIVKDLTRTMTDADRQEPLIGGSRKSKKADGAAAPADAIREARAEDELESN